MDVVVCRKTYKSPVGVMLIEADEKALIKLVFTNTNEVFSGDNPIINATIKQLNEYFNGERQSFELPLSVSGSDFQQGVWQEVSDIPYGKTKSYKDVALALQNLGAIRAVGKANGDNQFHIIIPCHRVIGTDGSLTGYAGGVEVKKHLLLLEGAIKGKQLGFFE